MLGRPLQFGYVGKGARAMRVLKQHILARVLLRRTKVDCADVLALPPRCALAAPNTADLQTTADIVAV